MDSFKEQKGMTMIALVITIIILVILSTMVTQVGMSSIKNSRFERIKNELELVQANVNLWYEKYIDYTYDEIPTGSKIPNDKKVAFSNYLKEINNEHVSKNIERYRYFSVSDFKNLQIEGIENEYIIDVKKQVAILAEEYEYEGNAYYMLDDVKTVARSGENIKEPIRLKNIILSPSVVNMKKNTTSEIRIELDPHDTNEKLKYISADESIIVIKDIRKENDGILIMTIQSNDIGRTTLTVINERGTVSSSCDVTVKK